MCPGKKMNNELEQKMKFKIIEATQEERKKNYKQFRDQFAKENNFEIMTAKDICKYIESISPPANPTKP